MRVCPECGTSTEQDVCPNDGRPTVDDYKLKVSSVNDSFVGMTLADKYVIEERLGRGGYGAVYRARHVETSGQVAIKLVRADLVDDEMVIRRFYIEAQNTHKLHHPNTVRVSDFGRTPDGVLYLVMEYVKGIPLSKVIKKEAPLSPERAVRIATQILKSLGEAHSHKLVHRDVKPQNIMLIDQFGEPDFVKVLDFGISRALDSTGASTKGLLGTPRYMAPEQWRSLPVDGRTDIYAVGCILYEMLAQRLPFDVKEARGTELAVGYMTAHVAKPPKPLTDVLGDQIPQALSDAIMGMLAKKKEDRPPNAQALLKQLAAIQRANPLSDVPPVIAGGKPQLPDSAESKPPTDTQTLDGDLIEITGKGATGHEDDRPATEISTEMSGQHNLVGSSRNKIIAVAAAVVLGIIGTVIALSGGSSEAGKEPVGAVSASKAVSDRAPKANKSGDSKAGEKAKDADTKKAAKAPAPKAVDAKPVAVSVATLTVTTNPPGATLKTTGGILLGTAAGEGGVKLTSPPLEQGQEVLFSLDGYKTAKVKVGFPAPGSERPLQVPLEAIPVIKFNLQAGTKVSIVETGSDLGDSPQEYMLTDGEAETLDKKRRLTLKLTKDGHADKQVVVTGRQLKQKDFSVSAVLEPVKTTRKVTARPTTRRKPKKTKKRALPKWNP